MQLAGFKLRNNLFVAPMAGVTDRPFRQLAKRMGAGLAVSEMVTSNALLYATEKTRRRTDHSGEPGPISVQIAGADPRMMAQAACFNVDQGAQIIDINMGCPAKKVCNVAAGSALMRDEKLVSRILEAVVSAVPDTPVTLKFRTGWDHENRNAATIARIAESSGIRLVAIHGRTRADLYMGEAEYDTIAEVKARITIPVIANGDIDSPQKARAVLAHTGADGLMIGRAAQGRPWIFREIEHYLATGELLAPPPVAEIHSVCRAHLADLYDFYGEDKGLRIARKHIAWYTRGLVGAAAFRSHMNLQETVEGQVAAVDDFYLRMAEGDSRLRYQEEFPEELAA
ncbi:MAG: tRNA dihydrouridine synthase DusB [Rhodocyclaceae bacterium]|nr:tRNA dihydrouridine synthase DusB [Rhodocyclaceae bacterium]MCB1899723.1 tRNA dihydrouridine synthase DusB [Rhodocyclaceae bacterium]MCP5308619.1 tRNA dihydrouridine synthase DusB [Zoogloeaceae bacterium]